MTNMAVIYKDAFGDNKWMEVEGSDSSMTNEEVKALFDKQTKMVSYEVLDVFSLEDFTVYELSELEL